MTATIDRVPGQALFRPSSGSNNGAVSRERVGARSEESATTPPTTERSIERS